MNDNSSRNALSWIKGCSDPKKLLQIVENARALGNAEVARAASLRLYAVLPSEAPGSLEYDVWQSIHALEHTLTIERGKTTRLARTRQKIERVGEQKTVVDLLLSSKPSEGFQMLLDREMPEQTFEAVALRHADRFQETELAAARARLAQAGEGSAGTAD